MKMLTFNKSQHKINIINDLRARASYTPDLLELKKYDNHLLFVYCTLKKSYKDNGILKDSIYLGEGKTQSSTFNLKESAFPVAFSVLLDSSPNKGRLKGEVYAVSLETIMKIDILKNNGAYHNRVKRQILLEDQKYTTHGKVCKPYTLCHIYLGNENYWNGRHLSQTIPYTITYPGTERPRQKVFEYNNSLRNVIWGDTWEDNQGNFLH